MDTNERDLVGSASDNEAWKNIPHSGDPIMIARSCSIFFTEILMSPLRLGASLVSR